VGEVVCILDNEVTLETASIYIHCFLYFYIYVIDVRVITYMISHCTEVGLRDITQDIADYIMKGHNETF